MTFEEFFVKKKIDVSKLREANPNLYEEFFVHYTQMGEKSFDHTKKYWFNRLRKDFLLKEVVSAKAVVALEDTTPLIREAATTVSSKPMDFKPRFKTDTSTQAPSTPTSDEGQTAPLQTPAKPMGFKPRFKAGTNTTQPKEQTASTDEGGTKEIGKTQPISTKPLGYKPRFKSTNSGDDKEETGE